MANDVKALPELPKPWDLQHDEDGRPQVLFTANQVLIYTESAIAELRAEVERWEQSAREGWRYAKECDDGRVEEKQRADTAEARLERARGLLNEATIHVYSLGLLERISAFLGEGK